MPLHCHDAREFPESCLPTPTLQCIQYFGDANVYIPVGCYCLLLNKWYTNDMALLGKETGYHLFANTARSLEFHRSRFHRKHPNARLALSLDRIDKSTIYLLCRYRIHVLNDHHRIFEAYIHKIPSFSPFVKNSADVGPNGQKVCASLDNHVVSCTLLVAIDESPSSSSIWIRSIVHLKSPTFELPQQIALTAVVGRPVRDSSRSEPLPHLNSANQLNIGVDSRVQRVHCTRHRVKS